MKVQAGHEVETIVHYAKEGSFDLLVIGFMGHSKIFGRVWGSTSQNITKLSRCTVIMVKYVLKAMEFAQPSRLIRD